LGWEYRNLHVKQADVVYLAVEGQGGFGNRAKAFRQEKLREGDTVERFHTIDIPFELVKDHVELIANIRAQSVSPGVVVIDTVNQSFTGSESSDADMTAYIRAAKAVRKAFGCVVILVHHCGINETRPRGHTSLHGADDVLISVKRDDSDNIICTVDDARDMESGKVIANKLKVVTVGTDEDGDPITSCVVEPTELNAGNRALRKNKKGERHQPKGHSTMKDAITEIFLSGTQEITLPRSTTKAQAVRIADVKAEFFSRYVVDTDDPDKADKATARQFCRELKKLPENYASCKISRLGWIYRL